MSRLIDVDNTFETFKNLPRCENGFSDTYDIETIIGILQDEPIVDAVPVVHGHWIETGASDDAGNKYYSCSCCNAGENHYPKVIVPYCWKCGAKMDEVTK